MKLSLLDQSPMTAHQTPHEALRSSLARAELAEDLGYARIWFAAHRAQGLRRKQPLTLTSAALDRTERIRVGTGGVLIGFHNPDSAAEAFLVLNQLHPGRVDAGVGRANAPVDSYVANLNRLSDRLAPSSVPVWVLGTGKQSAQTATILGAGYAYGHFFRPAGAKESLDARGSETPNLLAVRIITGPTREKVQHAADQFLAWRARKDLGANEALPAPDTVSEWNDPEAEKLIELNRPALVIGTPDAIAAQLHALSNETSTDEIMITNPDPSPEQSAWAMRSIAAELAGT